MAGCPPRRLGVLWEATIVDVTFRMFFVVNAYNYYIFIYLLYLFICLFETGSHHIALSVLELTT